MHSCRFVYTNIHNKHNRHICRVHTHTLANIHTKHAHSYAELQTLTHIYIFNKVDSFLRLLVLGCSTLVTQPPHPSIEYTTQ